MNKNLKKILVPFIITLIYNLVSYYLIMEFNVDLAYYPYMGLLITFGLLFGPYGAFGSLLGDIISGTIVGSPFTFLWIWIIIFGVSILAYKLWYTPFKGRRAITKPQLSSTNELMVFLGIILICGAIYTILSKNVYFIIDDGMRSFNFLMETSNFLNFINFSFIIGIIGIWISKYIDFVHIPEKSERKTNEKFYRAIGILLAISTIICFIIDFYTLNLTVKIIEAITMTVLLLTYITKPTNITVSEMNYNTIPKKITHNLFIVTMIIIPLSYLIASDPVLVNAISNILPVPFEEVEAYILIAMDLMLLLFLVPSVIVLRYIEKNVIDPIISFSEIEKYIKKGDKIKSNGLIEMYSQYINKNDEIGILARSYTDLIHYTNEYIENIRIIEGEKQKITAELNIAEKIQKSNLPTGGIENKNYSIYGYSKPAKEVGGDFFDYYEIDDDNLAFVIGDASGKGIPAALLSTITQAVIRQMLKNEKDPSKILYSLNNQLCEHNTEDMFITLWLGIYNKTTNIITFSNAGHDTPLINKGNGYEEIEMNHGIVLGIMEDFEYKKEEISAFDKLFLYTDGITDAKSADDEFYGEKRLIDTLNTVADKKEIETILKDIEEFAEGMEQFDDMTLVILEKK